MQASEAKQQRDEALNHVQLLTDKLEQVSSSQNGSIIPKDLRGLSIQKLKTLQVCSYFHYNHSFERRKKIKFKFDIELTYFFISFFFFSWNYRLN